MVSFDDLIPKKQISATEDAAKSIGSNLIGGGIDTAMILPNLINSVVAGPQLLGRGIADTISPMLGAEPQPRGELWQPFYGSGDVEKAMGTQYEPQTTAGNVAALPARIMGGLGGAKAIEVAPKIAGGIKGGVTREIKSLQKATPESSEQLRKSAKPFFDKFTQSGAKYSAKLTDEIADIADNARSTGIAGFTKNADEALNDALDFYSSLRGKPLSPSDVQKLDQSFADDIARFNKAGEYNFGRIINNLKYEFRSRAFDQKNSPKYVSGGNPDAVKNLVEGNRLWSQSYKAKDIEKILQKSMGTENPQTSIRTGIKNLLTNDKKVSGYSKEEIKVLEDAMKRGVLGGAMKLFGGRLTDSMGGAIAGFAAAGAPGAVAGSVAGKAAGGVMADAAGGVQANRLKNALQDIQNGIATSTASTATQSLSPQGAFASLLSTGQERGAQTAPAIPSMQPQTAPSLNFDDLIPQRPQSNAAPLNERIMQAESGGDVNAQNPNSSASGAYQFTDATWRSAVDKWGRREGIKYSDKANPQAQEAMMNALKQDNARVLQQKGIEPTDENLYFAHFMGAPAAAKAMSLLGKNAIAARSFPKAAASNPEIFFNKGKPRTMDEVYQIVTSKVN